MPASLRVLSIAPLSSQGSETGEFAEVQNFGALMAECNSLRQNVETGPGPRFS